MEATLKNHLQTMPPCHRPTRRLCVASALLMLALALSACGGGNSAANGTTPTDGKIRVAPNPDDQWTLVPAAEVGMDGAILAKAVSTLPGEQVHGLSSMLVTRHAKPVLEHYWNGYDKDTLHDLRSATKSITSLMMGVAIDRHIVAGVGDTLASHLGARYPDAPAYRLGLTLDNMLTMRSGLDCNDWQAGSPGNESKMYDQADWIKFYTSLQAIEAPGSIARYCTGNPVALGRVIAEGARQSIPAFASEFLFGPLHIQSARWAQFDHGTQTDTGGHIQMRPRDMVKLGQLVLQQGQWNGQQLVSPAWIAESTRQHTQFNTLPRRNGYGYLWWRSVEIVNGKSYDMIFADGNGGQLILIVPALDLVAVFTGENYNSSKAELPFQILDAYILGAVQ